MKQNYRYIFSLAKKTDDEGIFYSVTSDESGEYGIEVLMSETGEKVYLPAITRDVQTAREIVSILYKHTVFPQNVPEIFDDMLAERACI